MVLGLLFERRLKDTDRPMINGVFSSLPMLTAGEINKKQNEKQYFLQ